MRWHRVDLRRPVCWQGVVGVSGAELENELSEVDQVVQWLFPQIEDLTPERAATVHVAADQLHRNTSKLVKDLKAHLADNTEKGVHEFAGAHVEHHRVPSRKAWDNDQLLRELKAAVLREPNTGRERTGEEVWDKMLTLVNVSGATLAKTVKGRDLLAATLGLATANDLDEFCELSWSSRITVTEPAAA